MSDASVAKLLRSAEPLVVIEAAAGCGKTFQGAAYARDIVDSLGPGRLLILTHTHAACAVFAERTRGAASSVEIRTIDALITQIATAYHKPLGLPRDLTSWAWQDNGKGFEIMASKVSAFLRVRPGVARALAHRYPIIICDEHQDSTVDQHRIVMALRDAGAMLRIFGDPLQRIYGEKTEKAARVDRERWEALKSNGASDRLTTPHRWKQGCPALGDWILSARTSLENSQPIDLTARPPSLRLLVGNNTAQMRTGYQLSKEHRAPVDRIVRNADQLMILASQKDLVASLRAFWNRSIPIWEGHTRDALATLVGVLRENEGNAQALAEGVVTFVSEVAVGFTDLRFQRSLRFTEDRVARVGSPHTVFSMEIECRPCAIEQVVLQPFGALGHRYGCLGACHRLFEVANCAAFPEGALDQKFPCVDFRSRHHDHQLAGLGKFGTRNECSRFRQEKEYLLVAPVGVAVVLRKWQPVTAGFIEARVVGLVGDQ